MGDEMILRKLREKKYACYLTNCNLSSRDEIARRPARELKVDESYLLVALVGDGTDADALQQFAQKYRIPEPEVEITESDYRPGYTGTKVPFMTFLVKKEEMKINTEAGTIHRSFASFAEIIDNLPEIPAEPEING